MEANRLSTGIKKKSVEFYPIPTPPLTKVNKKQLAKETNPEKRHIELTIAAVMKTKT